jgi:hypothetical protein
MDDLLKRLLLENNELNAKLNSRRHFLKECTLGLGGIALGSLLNSCANDQKRAYDYSANRAFIASIFSQGKKRNLFAYGGSSLTA